MSNTSSGTFRLDRRLWAMASPKAAMRMPPRTESRMAVWTVFSTISRSSRPRALAMTTLAPRPMPTKKFTTRDTMAELELTAATQAFRASPVKLPTTARSEALKSCPRMAVAAMGRANWGILFQIEPWIISISARFVRDIVLLLQIDKQ